MLLPLSWLKQFVTVNESPESVAERFVNLGFEAEDIQGEVIDLDITPNRGDLLSIYGLAREYAASTKQSMNLPVQIELNFTDTLPNFMIHAEEGTYHRLSSIIAHEVTIGPSPAWLKDALASVGQHSINSIVDLTNYVMFELGVPIHAFDLDKLPEQEFTIRFSRKGETYLSLKDEALTLPEGTVVVECGGQIIDLVGIRGSKSCMITEQTKNILIWANAIPRPLIRRTSKLLGLRTEASYRYERETDWEIGPVSIERMAKLVTEIAGGTLTTGYDNYPVPHETKQIALNAEKTNQLLATNFDDAEVESYLNRLGFTFENGDFKVPSWRYFDCHAPEDLIEEVARMHGYNSLPRNVIASSQQSAPTDFGRIEALKDRLVADGWTETYTESFIGTSEAQTGNFDESKLAKLANPVNRDYAFCRPSIAPSLVKLLALNSWSDDAKVFEIAHVFPEVNQEITHVAFAAYGKQNKLFERYVPADAIEVLPPEHPLANLFKIRRAVTIAEVAVDSLIDHNTSSYTVSQIKPPYTNISAFPPSIRDISMIINTNVDLSAITKDIKDTAPESIILVEIFDTFQSDTFGPNKQSVAIHVVYQSLEKTLESETVDMIQANIITKLQTNYQAVIR